MYDNQIKQQFISLRAQGKSLSQSAKALGIARSTAKDWNKIHAPEIEMAKKFPMELVFGGFGLDKGERMKSIAGIAGTLREKLQKNSSEESFHRDLHYFIKLAQMIGDEEDVEKKEITSRGNLASLKEPPTWNPEEYDGRYDTLYYVMRDSPNEKLIFEGQFGEIDIRGTELEKKILEWCGDETGIQEDVYIPDEALKQYGIDPESARKPPPSLDEFLLSGLH